MAIFAPTADPNEVFVGLWTNWSHGRVLGWTLTLTSPQGALLIAFLAFFVTVAASAVWRIATYILHHALSARAPAARDGLYHQRQAILRNSSNAVSGLVYLTRSGWAWRHTAPSTPKRMLPVILFTAFCVAMFAIASGFSSKVATSLSNEVLVSVRNCRAISYGEMHPADCLPDGNVNEQVTDQAEINHRASIYASNCYSDGYAGRLAAVTCNILVNSRLPVTEKTDAACPVDKNICRSNHSNIFLDTGLLDSNLDLGLNSPDSGKFLYRTTTQCAPLKTEHRARRARQNTTEGEVSYKALYYYGGIMDRMNYTFVAPLFWTLPSPGGINPKYLLGTSHWSPSQKRCLASWMPIPELRLPDAEVELIWLTADSIMYSAPTLDPWYEATTVEEISKSHKFYIRDHPASPIVCVQREQYCNPNLPRAIGCTSLMGPDEIKPHVLDLWKNDKDMQNTMQWMMQIKRQNAPSLGDIIVALGPQALLAGHSVTQGGAQIRLSDTQWQSDVRYWFSTKLAGLQQAFLDVGKPHWEGIPIRKRLPDAVSERICKNQKILSSKHTSFTMVYLLLIFLLGMFFIIISYSLDFLYKMYARYWKGASGGTEYAQMEWWANDTLQLQRMAHESAGLTSWKGNLDEIPITSHGDKLAILDFENPQRPKLRVAYVYDDGATLVENVENKESNQGFELGEIEIRTGNQ